jgi:hypothetical protein
MSKSYTKPRKLKILLSKLGGPEYPKGSRSDTKEVCYHPSHQYDSLDCKTPNSHAKASADELRNQALGRQLERSRLARAANARGIKAHWSTNKLAEAYRAEENARPEIQWRMDLPPAREVKEVGDIPDACKCHAEPLLRPTPLRYL